MTQPEGIEKEISFSSQQTIAIPSGEAAKLMAIRKSDWQRLKHRIEQAFERAADLDAETISIEAKDGKVVLRGTVQSWAEREQAEFAAWAAPGVSRVENHLLIGSEEEIVASL